MIFFNLLQCLILMATALQSSVSISEEVIHLHDQVSVPAPDNNKKCKKFAAEGYCEVNPSFMMKNCATTFQKWKSQSIVTDFYSIVETDIYGASVSFESLRGKFVYMINVASEDGDSKDNYSILKNLSNLRSEIFEIIIFPCNQFGEKEPRADRDVAFFARKHGYRGIVMSKGDVNGVNTRPAIRYLKANSLKKHINGNFDGRYFMDRNGKLEALHPSVDVVDMVIKVLSNVNSEL